MIDHGYIKRGLLEEFFANAIVENTYFSDHDAVQIVIEKNSVDFHNVPLSPVRSSEKEEFIGFLAFLVILIHLAVYLR